MNTNYTDKQLIYAATARCRCGAGMAHPLSTDEALKLRAWMCSAVLKGEAAAPNEHEALPFAFWKVREETSINNSGAFTTRPPGTKCLTQGQATCPKCDERWQSEPYSACGLSHHWFSGPCPNCGYAVGGGGSYSSDEGKPIEVRFRDVVLEGEA